MTLLEYMKKNFLTQHDVAKELDVTNVTIHNWIKNKTRPHPGNLKKLWIYTNGEVFIDRKR